MSLTHLSFKKRLGEPGAPAARSWVMFKRAFYENGRDAFGEWP